MVFRSHDNLKAQQNQQVWASFAPNVRFFQLAQAMPKSSRMAYALKYIKCSRLAIGSMLSFVYVSPGVFGVVMNLV